MRRVVALLSVLALAACGDVLKGEPDSGVGGSDAAGDGSTLLDIDTCSTAVAFENLGDVWTIATDGTGLAQITSDGVSRAPEWSPDGGSLSFVSGRDGADGVYTQAVGSATPVKVGAADVPASDPQWIPGTATVAYTVENGNDVSLIGVEPGDRAIIRDIGTMLPGTEIGWSEAGDRYVFFGLDLNGNPANFWIGNVGGTGRSGFTIAGVLGASSWSPGDDRIAYELDRDVFSVSSGAGTGTIQNLTNLTGSLRAETPQWISSNLILFTRTNANGSPANLYIMNDDGSNQQPLTTNDQSANGTLSPDNKQIAFDFGGQIGVMQLNADQSVGPIITLTTGGRPRWRPCP